MAFEAAAHRRLSSKDAYRDTSMENALLGAPDPLLTTMLHRCSGYFGARAVRLTKRGLEWVDPVGGSSGRSAQTVSSRTD